jgi:chromosome segregation ATPase
LQTLLGADSTVEHELEDMRRQLARKEEAYNEATALTKNREAQLSAADRAVQILKVASKEREEIMHKRFKQMHDLEVSLLKRIEHLGHEKEHLVAKKDKERVRKLQTERKLDGFLKEFARIKDHTTPLVDSDVWVDGVLQRMHTKEFRKYLKASAKKQKQELDEVETGLSKLRQDIVECTDRLNKAKRDLDKLSVSEASFHASYKSFTASLATQVSQDLVTQQTTASVTEDRRVKDRNHEMIASIDEAKTAVDLVRVKDADLRSKDERKFVGIDLVLYPEAYLHVSLVEAEQMQFDPDYQCNLAKSDLERIKNLPEQVLRCPFVYSLSAND